MSDIRKTHRLHGLAIGFFFWTVCISPAAAQSSLNDLLTPYLARYHLPALAAAVVQDGKTLAAGAVGTRWAGTNLQPEIDSLKFFRLNP